MVVNVLPCQLLSIVAQHRYNVKSTVVIDGGSYAYVCVACGRMCAALCPLLPPLARPSHAYLALPSGRLALGGGLSGAGERVVIRPNPPPPVNKKNTYIDEKRTILYDKCMILTIDTKELTPDQYRKIFNVLNPPRSTEDSRKATKSVRKVNNSSPTSASPTPSSPSLTLNPRTYPEPKDNYPPDHIPTTYVPFKEYPELTYGALEEEFPASVSLPDNFNDLTTLIPALEQYAASCDMPLQDILRDIA